MKNIIRKIFSKSKRRKSLFKIRPTKVGISFVFLILPFIGAIPWLFKEPIDPMQSIPFYITVAISAGVLYFKPIQFYNMHVNIGSYNIRYKNIKKVEVITKFKQELVVVYFHKRIGFAKHVMFEKNRFKEENLNKMLSFLQQQSNTK